MNDFQGKVLQMPNKTRRYMRVKRNNFNYFKGLFFFSLSLNLILGVLLIFSKI